MVTTHTNSAWAIRARAHMYVGPLGLHTPNQIVLDLIEALVSTFPKGDKEEGKPLFGTPMGLQLVTHTHPKGLVELTMDLLDPVDISDLDRHMTTLVAGGGHNGLVVANALSSTASCLAVGGTLATYVYKCGELLHSSGQGEARILRFQFQLDRDVLPFVEISLTEECIREHVNKVYQYLPITFSMV